MGLTQRFRSSVLSMGILTITGLSIGSILEAQSSLGVDMVISPADLARAEVHARSLRLPDGRVMSWDGQGVTLRGLQGGQTQTVSFPSPRSGAAAVVLPDGRVLIWGGADVAGTLMPVGLWLNPASLRFTDAVIPALSPGLGQTFSVLEDGEILVTGGWDIDRRLFEQAAIWDPIAGTRRNLVNTNGPRFGQSSIVQGDGSVLLRGGVDASMRPVDEVLRFDPATRSFSAVSAALVDQDAFALVNSAPSKETEGVPLGSLVGMRFSEPLDPTSVTGASVSLVGPAGPVSASVASVQGRLAFVVPHGDLFPGTHYTVVLAGVRGERGRSLPFTSFGFTTATLGGDAPASGYGGQVANGQDAITNGHASIDTSTSMTLYRSTGIADRARTTQIPACQKHTPQGYRLCRDKGMLVDGAWYPGQDNAGGPDGGHWRLNVRDFSPAEFARSSKGRKPLVSQVLDASGTGSVQGQLHLIDGRPLAHVRVSIGEASTFTVADGSFLLAGAPLGKQSIFVDGRTANDNAHQYGQFEFGVNVMSTGTTLDRTLYMPRILDRDRIELPSPTTYDMVVTHPDMPGLEVHIPAGTVIRDHDGKIVNELSIVPMPTDRAPYPTPVNFAVYFSLQPGGASVQNVRSNQPQGITLTYPNYGHVPAGYGAKFIAYTPTDGWRAYGAGTVTPDGSQLKAEAGVRLTTLTSGSWAMDNRHPGDKDPAKPDGACCGDPVDLQSGTLVENVTDVALPDVMPIASTRTWHSTGSSALKNASAVQDARAFGSWRGNYDMFIDGTWDTITVRMPDGTVLSPWTELAPNPGGDGRWIYAGNIAAFAGTTIDAKYDLNYKQCLNGVMYQCYVVNTPDGTRYYSDPLGGLYEIRDRFENRTQIVRDAGLISQVISPNGRYLAYTYNSDNNISSVSDNTGRTWKYDYHKLTFPAGAWADGGPQSGASTATLYLLDTVTYPDQTTTRYTYNEDTSSPSSTSGACAAAVPGTLATIVDRNGTRVVSNTYCGVKVATQTAADGGVMSFAYGVNETSVTDSLGNVRKLVFGPTGYPVSDTRAAGTPIAQTTTYVRDASGQLTSVTDALNRTTHYTWDERGNPLSATRLYGTSDAITRHWTWNAANDPLTMTDELGHVTSFQYTDGCLTGIVDAKDQLTNIVCNSQGRSIEISDPMGHATRIDYLGGDLRSVTDPLGRKASFSTDEIGRVVSATSPDGSIARQAYDLSDRPVRYSDASGRDIQITYDNEGHPLTVKTSNGGVVNYAYDLTYRVQRRADALGQAESWTWDTNGNLQTHTDRMGQVSTYDPRDSLNRFVRVTYADGTSVTANVYDKVGRLLQWTDTGDGETVRVYDALDRLLQETTSRGKVAYTYDALGRRISMQANSQAAIRYSYDVLGRVTGLAQDNAFVTYNYDAASRRVSLTLPNGMSSIYGYDDAGEVTSINYSRNDGSVVGSLTYAYGVDGRIVSRGGSLAALSLPQAYLDPSQFDLNNRASKFAKQSVSYDKNGDLLEDGERSYKWDARRRLTSVTRKDGFSASFFYDSSGRRTKKIVNDLATEYLYDGSNEVEVANASFKYPVLSGMGVDERYAVNTAHGVRYLLRDIQGSTVMLTDLSENVVGSYQYGPYGEALDNSSTDIAYQYAGRERDETGLYYYRARYYDPVRGAFLSEDPIGWGGGQDNFYGYVGADPVNHIDPNGLDAILLVNSRTVDMPSGRFGGHAAVAIGSDKTGWNFYQEGGIVNGVQETTSFKFNTLNELETSITGYKNGIGVTMILREAYDVQQGERTSPAQDVLMNAWAKEHLHDPFNGRTNNCGDFVLGVLRAGGLDPRANSVGPTIPNWMSIGPDNSPNRFHP